MAQQPEASTTPGSPATLNEHHRRHLLASCQYVDRLLSDIDNIVTATETDSPFARYAADLSPTLRKLLRDYFAQLRRDMLRVLNRHDAMPSGRRISAVHTIRTALGFVEISIEELKPEYIRGYGHVPVALVPEINGFVEELQSIVRALDRALASGQGADAHDRLARLERAGAEVGVLSVLERIIAEQGLVEFRPALETALSRLEDQRFEVAVFGRVSSGKSSLLNHLMGLPVLPVGVTPITAVPTRVMYGETPGIEVHFADRKTEETGLDRLPEFVTEQENPANTKHVTRLIVRVPAERLKDGIVFVDTPGLGSLATSGAAETLAYLPRCDLAVVLVDAVSTLTDDDIQTMHRLQQAAIPAMVVLSKADLLSPDDRDRALAYTMGHVSRELGMAVSIHAISTTPGHESLLNAWLEDDLRPLLAQHRELARRSIQRKIGALRAGVMATLAAQVRRATQPGRTAAGDDVTRIEQSLRNTAGVFDDVRRTIDALGDARTEDIDENLAKVASLVANRLLSDATSDSTTVVAASLGEVGRAQGDALSRVLTGVAEQSKAVLAQAAEVFHLPAPVGDEEWSTLLRELPQIDPGPLTVSLRLPGLKSLGKRVGSARVRHALLAQAGPQVREAFETHAKLLRSWGRRVLERLRGQFDVQAQVYRSQIAGASPATDDASVSRALQELEGLENGVAVS